MSASSGGTPHGAEASASDGRDGLAGATQFVNRVRELEQLRAALNKLARGAPARQLIQGEGGVGKSRLLGEAISGDVRHDVATFTGRAREFETDRPFGILIDALGLRANSSEAGAAAIGRLLLRARDPSRIEERHNLIPRFVEHIDRLCSARPVALVLTDMQWADPMSAITVASALEELAGRPLGVLITRRPIPLNPPLGDLVELARPQFERIALRGLEPKDVWSLARGLSGAEPGQQLARLLAGTAGNPSMIVSLIQGLRREHGLQVVAGVAETDATLPPRSMWPRVMGQLARQTDSCQDLLTLAALFGGRVAVATLATAAARSTYEVQADLREAIAGGILTEVDDMLGFTHELVRVILVEATPASLRSELRRRIAEVRSAASIPVSAGARAEPAGGPGQDEVVLSGVPAGWERATRAEREVVRHVVDGLSNREIGERLFVSARTVETHLSHVYAKLGVSSRVELTGVVMRNSTLRAELVESAPAPSTRQTHRRERQG
ncbi:MAG: AAA family ATPase [Candidatus Dormibacter sp.]